MMGLEGSNTESRRLFPLTDGMESLVLDEPAHHMHTSNSDQASPMPENPSGSVVDPLSALKDETDPVEGTYRMSFSRSSNSRNRDDVFVEPPSHADAIFTPYSGDIATGNGSSRSSRDYGGSLPRLPSSSPFPNYLSITVSQPQKFQDNTSSSIIPGSNTYVTYLIVTQTNIPQYEGRDFTVRRRFRDVVTLADRLAEAYRGYFIPARPDKSIVESQVMQKQEFIEQRRAAIEKYVCRLANHPILRMSDELRLFLQSQGKLPLIPTTDIASRMLDGAANLPRQLFGEGSVVMAPEDVAQPAKGGRDLVRLFKELRQSVTIEWGGVKPAVTEEDKEFLERKLNLEELEHCLNEASQKAEVLVTAQQDVGEIMGELGLTFTKLAKFESEEALLNAQSAHAADAKRLATAAVQASRFYREANAQSVRHLDQLHENLSLMQSINTAFKDRSTALLTVQMLISEVSSLNTKIEKLKLASSKIFGGDKTRDRKIEELKEALATMEESRDSATREYNRIKDKDSGLLKILYLQTVLGRVLHRYAAQIPPNRIEIAGYRFRTAGDRMDGYREEGSSSQDRQSIPIVHEVGEGSSQTEEGFPHAAFSITGTASPGTVFRGMQGMVPNPMHANIGMQPRFWGTQGQFGVSQGNLGMAGFSIPSVKMTPRHQHVTGLGVQMAPIGEINKSELERFDCDRERDFLEMVKGYVLTQVGYAEKIANVWSRAAEEFNPQASLPNFLAIDVGIYVMLIEGEDYPIILERPWLMAMKAKKNYGTGLLKMQGPKEEEIFYNMKTGKQQDLSLETSVGKFSTESTTTSEGKSTND
ncbi:hypothetical protein L7F22_034535 [Adiantum nelumboides]|nr:hypothetical protein [Adiantum nelumboides]